MTTQTTSSTTPLTTQYVEEHSLTIHDPDSWAKALQEVILRKTKEKVESCGPQKEIKMDVPVTVSANTKGCITVCAWGVCVHVKV